MSIISYKDSLGNAHWPDAPVGSAKYYGVDWGDYLTAEGDTIGTASWDVPTGLTDSDDSIVSDVARIKLSADTAGEYTVTCTITSTEGAESQTHVQKMRLKVV
jgi:hypothetical protein